MRNFPHSLRHLDTWSPVGDTVGRNVDWADSLETGFKIKSLVIPQFISPLPACD